MEGQPIDPDTIYGVVTKNFVRNGSDGYKVFAAEVIDPYDYGPDIADVVAEYMSAQETVASRLEGRITRVE